MNSSFFDLYLFYINTGCRPSEALGLDFRSIFAEARSIKVEQQWDYHQSVLKLPKTKRTRVIPMNPTILTLINNRRHQACKGSKHYKHPDRSVNTIDTNFVFHDGMGNPLDYYKVAKDLKQCCFKAGLEHHGLYLFRHSYATHFILKHGDKRDQLQKFMGHTDYKTTQKYIHLVEDQLKQNEYFLDFSYPKSSGNVISLGG